MPQHAGTPPLTVSRDSRSPQARAYAWASRLMTISLSMVIPGLLGYAIDRRLRWKGVFTIVGFMIGMSYGMWQLLKIARRPEGGARGSTRKD